MKLFIITNILTNTHPGMVIIAANNKTECRKVFFKEFDGNDVYEDEFDNASIKVIENVTYDAEVVSYVYGGG